MAASAAATDGPPLAGNIQVSLGRGTPAALMTHPSGASCEVVLAGAHVTSWKTKDGVERLFVSSASEFGNGAAIRGGIPVCWPQFSGRGNLPKHGFLRTSSDWEIAEMSSENGECRLVLSMCDSDATRELWPHKFEVRYAVTLSADGLDTELEVINTGDAELAFHAALHTYFSVSDVAGCTVTGLDGLTYEDNTQGGAVAQETRAELQITGEIDNVYLDAPSSLVLRYPQGAGQLRLSKSESFRDVVLWNLGAEKAPSMKDLGAGEWQQYVCLEAAAIGTPVSLAPGATWKGSQSFACETPGCDAP